jgi:hypothetical protein
MCPRAQNMKTGPDAPSTARKEFGSAKHENWTQRLGTAKTSPGAKNMKAGPDILGSVEN